MIFVYDTVKDNSKEIIRTHQLASRWTFVEIDRPGRGLAAAYNMGWRAARSPHVFFMHVDCYPKDNDALARMAEWLRRENAVAVEPLVDIPQGDWDSMSFWDRVTSSQFRHAKPAHSLIGKLDLIRRDALDQLGGFDEERFFSAHEDADMHERLLGLGTIAISDVVVIHAHHHPASSPFVFTLRKHIQSGEGFGAWVRKNGLGLLFRRHVFPLTVINMMKMAFLLGILVPPISIYSLALLLILAMYYARWALLTRDWRVPLIPFAVSLMFAGYVLGMVRGYVRDRQSFHYFAKK